MHAWRRVHEPYSKCPVTHQVDWLEFSATFLPTKHPWYAPQRRKRKARTLCRTGRAPAQQERLARGRLSRTPCAAHHLQVLRALDDANALPLRQPSPSAR